MLVSVVSCHTELLTPALCSVHVADVACCASQGSRPFATNTVVQESAAVLNRLALVTTAMLAAEFSADAPPRVCVAAALTAELAFRLAAASTTIWLASAKLLVELSAAAPLSCRVPAADRLAAALSAELACVTVAVGSALSAELAVRLDAAGLVTLAAALMAELAVRLAEPARPSVAADSFEPRLARFAAPCCMRVAVAVMLVLAVSAAAPS
jgi:hypothetical protein